MKPKHAIIAVAVLLAAALAAWAYYPPFRLFAIYAAGRSPSCPLNQAVFELVTRMAELYSADRPDPVEQRMAAE